MKVTWNKADFVHMIFPNDYLNKWYFNIICKLGGYNKNITDGKNYILTKDQLSSIYKYNKKYIVSKDFNKTMFNFIINNYIIKEERFELLRSNLYFKDILKLYIPKFNEYIDASFELDINDTLNHYFICG